MKQSIIFKIIIFFLIINIINVITIGQRNMINIGANQNVMMHLIGQNISFERAALLVYLADLSTCTMIPNFVDCDGLMENGDRVVVTGIYILWFAVKPRSSSITNGGNGMLRGIWTIYCCDEVFQWNFKFIENEYNWAPNEIFPGADSISQGSGLSLQIRLINNHDTPDPLSIGLENSQKYKITNDGQEIIDGGLFSGSGVFYQTQGLLSHFEQDINILQMHGFHDIYDMNNYENLFSKIQYTLTYRISQNSNYFRQELTLRILGPDPTSSIATLVMSSCSLGSAKWSANCNVAQVGRVRNHGTWKPSCSLVSEYDADVCVLFNQDVIMHHGLDYFENNANGNPGNFWYITGPSQRSLKVVLPNGFSKPEHIQSLLNGYSTPGVGAVCIDLKYTDINDCGVNTTWNIGYTYSIASDYSTFLNLN